MKKTLNIAMVGLGGRGTFMLRDTISLFDDVKVVALCDLYEDRVEENAKALVERGCERPKTFTDYNEMLKLPEIDAVVVTSAWESHIDVSCACMEAGKPVGFEVGGAYTIDDLWRLIHTYEKTGTPCAMLENCCYGDDELLVLNMVREGVFGEVVHCAGGYRHDLREEVSRGRENRHYRFRNYLNRCCDNYPTHDLGPIANVLDINHGNRMLSLVSMASKARGLHEYILKDKGPDYDAASFQWAQGDVVTTTIKCAHGETIVLTLDTTLPRPYSRAFHVQGTKGMYDEDNKSIYLDGLYEEWEEWNKHWGNVEEYRDKYEHPLQKAHKAMGSPGGHGGMDWLELNAFFNAVREGRVAPVDVYDAASWMCISVLTEESIAKGGLPVSIPDFTNGKWTMRPRWEP